MIKTKELRSMTKDDLSHKIIEIKGEMMKVNAQNKTGAAVKNTAQIKNSKKTIAKIKTIINEKTKNE